MRAENVGGKCEIMRPENPDKSLRAASVLGNKWETSLKSCGQRTQSVVGDKSKTSAKSRGPKRSENRVSFAGKQARRQTPNHAARACTPFKGVRIPHRQACLGKNPEYSHNRLDTEDLRIVYCDGLAAKKTSKGQVRCFIVRRGEA